MPPLLRAVAAALALAAFTLTAAFGGPNEFDDSPDKVEKRPDGALGPCMEFAQIKLTEQQIAGLLAAADEIDEIRENSSDGFYKTGPATTAKLDAVARKHDLSGYDEFKTIRANVIHVFSGYDAVTKRYVGREQLIRVRVARTRADRRKPANEKAHEIEITEAQRQCTLPAIKFRSNIELVHKHYDALRVSNFQR
ncbi:hypothetical protein [Bradyrhizobium sp. USDA 4353]